jgi:hypothetical protein
MSTMPDPQIQRWTRWINDTVYRNVVRIHFHRQIWQGVQEVIRANDQLPPSAFWAYHLELYVDTQAVAVRRQADLDHRVASLGRLISEINDESQRLTSDWWLEQWAAEDEDQLEFAHGRWTTDFGGQVGEHLDPAIPAADLEQLLAAAGSVRTYVNQTIAHAEDFELTQAEPPAGIWLHEIDSAIDTIGDLFRKYADLIACVDIDLHATWHRTGLRRFAWLGSRTTRR